MAHLRGCDRKGRIAKIVFHLLVSIVIRHVQTEHMLIERSCPFYIRDRIDGEGDGDDH